MRGLFHISKSKVGDAAANEAAIVKKVLAYIERNRGQLAAEHFVQTEDPDLGVNSLYDIMTTRSRSEGRAWDLSHKYACMSFVACLPVISRIEKRANTCWLRSSMYREVNGRVGRSLHLDMQGWNCGLR